jgi:Ca2+-binding EF-hand superfamily protein
MMKQTFLEKGPCASEAAVDHLEQMLRTKYEQKTGFAEKQQLARTMQAALRAMDVARDDAVDLEQFRLVMVKFNCGDNVAAVDALFARYDHKGKGCITVQEFSKSLFGITKVPMSSPACRDVIKTVRELLLSRGENGYRGLVRILRRMDDNGNRKLESNELAEGMQVYGINLTANEQATLFSFFDKDGDGHIDITEFMVGLRPTISAARLAIVKLAFLKLDKNPDGQVTLEELKTIYQTENHPNVLDGTKTGMDVLAEFNDAWDRNGDDVILEAEFVEYYRDLSASIDNDAYFELMLRNAWHITGGKGAAANTANLRVLVTHLDGTQTVETIEDDMGLPDTNSQTLANALRKQGVSDILKVQTSS